MTYAIYTIGYSGFTIDEFLGALISHKVNAVIEVIQYSPVKHHTENVVVRPALFHKLGRTSIESVMYMRKRGDVFYDCLPFL